MKDKVSGAIAIPKASWGCAPALPNRIRMAFLGTSFSPIPCIQQDVFQRSFMPCDFCKRRKLGLAFSKKICYNNRDHQRREVWSWEH